MWTSHENGAEYSFCLFLSGKEKGRLCAILLAKAIATIRDAAGIEAARYLRTGKMSGFANQQFMERSTKNVNEVSE